MLGRTGEEVNPKRGLREDLEKFPTGFAMPYSTLELFGSIAT
jgi:hypothetical protein